MAPLPTGEGLAPAGDRPAPTTTPAPPRAAPEARPTASRFAAPRLTETVTTLDRASRPLEVAAPREPVSVTPAASPRSEPSATGTSPTPPVASEASPATVSSSPGAAIGGEQAAVAEHPDAPPQLRPRPQGPFLLDGALAATIDEALVAAPLGRAVDPAVSAPAVPAPARAMVEIEPILTPAAKPTLSTASPATDPVPAPVTLPTTATPVDGPLTLAASNPARLPTVAPATDGATIASAPVGAPATSNADPLPATAPAVEGATVASAPVAAPAAEPEPTPAAVAREASATAPPPPAVRVAAPPVMAALDTATQLAARPASTPRATTTRALAVAEPPAPTLTTAGALAATAAAAAPAPPAPVDMTRPAWPAAMIHRIERLRDELDAVSTAIRLIPDALGAIDVRLTQEGEVTHVHLAAEQPQTRALLAEAAPKLAELAEQRGLRLGEAQVGTGPGSNGGQQPAAQQSRRPAAPSTPAAPERADATTDERIA